jgi:hypothetical protein
MGNEQALRRPIGWWLKEADARLTVEGGQKNRELAEEVAEVRRQVAEALPEDYLTLVRLLHQLVSALRS